MAEKKPILSTPPSLVGEKLYLRPATAKDIAETHHWQLLDEPQRYNFSQHPLQTAGEASEAFKAGQKSENHQTFVIVTIKQNTPVGLIHLFDQNSLNGSAQFTILTDPDERKKEHVIEASRLLCSHMFRFHGLNKVYTLVSEIRDKTIRQLKSAGFHEDGTLRQHHFFDGRYHDVKIFSMMRFEFAQ